MTPDKGAAMRRSLIVLCLLALSSAAVGAGYALWAYTSTDTAELATGTQSPVSSSSGAVGLTAEPPAAPSKSAADPAARATAAAPLAIEVARIDAGGPSVLAGRSPPHHTVRVLANGREVARVTATDEGQWSAIVSEGIQAGPLELTLESHAPDGSALTRSAARQLVVPAATEGLASAGAPAPRSSPVLAAKPAIPESAGRMVEGPRAPGATSASARAEQERASDKRALAEFEALVEGARKEMAAQASASTDRASAGAETAQPAAPGAVDAGTASSHAADVASTVRPQSRGGADVVAAGRPLAPSASPAVAANALADARSPAAAPIPVPITFVTDGVGLTPDGERAVALLAEYLRIKRPAGITLSGHADARGTDRYNMELSRRRLESVQRYLRAAGYTGEMSLVPRGKREPYRGIDRRRLSLDEVRQADRRVELHLTP